MKRLFLTSSVGTPGVAASIRKRLGHDRQLRTAFITTPIECEDMSDDQWYQDDRRALRNADFDFFDYTITNKSLPQIQKDLADIECLYISGGNNNYLLGKSQESEFAAFVKEFVEQGKPYIGTSAGSIVAGPVLPPYLWGEEQGYFNLTDYTCYNLVNFTVIPHWGSEWFKDRYLHGRMEQVYDPSGQPLILLNDNQYVVVQDEVFHVVDVRSEK